MENRSIAYWILARRSKANGETLAMAGSIDVAAKSGIIQTENL
jgi:hypothetical protein